MPRPVEKILKDIEEFQPLDADWVGLETLVNELWENPPQLSWVEPLLRVFDRFSDESSAPVFLQIMHGLEDIGGYEPILMESQRNSPCFLKYVMSIRIEMRKHLEKYPEPESFPLNNFTDVLRMIGKKPAFYLAADHRGNCRSLRELQSFISGYEMAQGVQGDTSVLGEFTFWVCHRHRRPRRELELAQTHSGASGRR